MTTNNTEASIFSLARDVSYSLRRLRHAPAFALVAMFTLALGIASNATIFSIVSRFVLRPPPVGDPATLVALHLSHHNECCNQFPWPLLTDLRDQAKSFSGIAAYDELVPASVGGGGEPQRVWGQAVTSNFFDVAQIPMTLGRGFSKTEENFPVVVLGYGLWQHRFAADPAIVGKTISLSGHPFTVIGVAPPAFRGVDFILDCQFWVPLGEMDQLLPNTSNFVSRNYHWLAVVARLKPGVTSNQTAAELDLLAKRMFGAHRQEEYDDGFRFEQAGSLPPRDKNAVIMFLAALSVVALLVLGIAAANVTNLFMAQASGRQKEMSIRLAIGATRAHILRQMLTESLLLAVGGGVVGVALSFWATQSLAAFRFPAPVPLDLSVNVDWRVLSYSFVLSVVAGILFGLAPGFAAVRSTRTRPGGFWSLRNVLVVSQIAMSVVLLCATGLFLRSLENASQINIGFRSQGLLIMSVDPRLHGYSPERITQFLDILRQRVSVLPGVTSATYTDSVPLAGGNRSDSFHPEDQPLANRPDTGVELYMAGPDYFQTIGTTLIAGHDFSSERASGPKVAIINQALADTFFKNQNPIGRRVTGRGVTYQVIGVVKNIKSRFLGEEYRPVLYRSLAQDIGGDPSFTGYSILVAFNRNPASIANAMRREIHSLDPSLAIFGVETISEHLRDALFLPRLGAALFGTFGFIGLSLAAVGLYGVMNSWVSRRTREIGIRLALGARVGQIQGLVVWQGMVLTLCALLPGLASAWAVSKLFSSALYGVRPHDGPTFVLVPLFLVIVAALACWLPARRAAGAEPLDALRHE